MAVCGLVVVLAGCATEKPFVNPLSVSQRAGMHIAEVEVHKAGGEESATLAGKLKTALEAYFADTPTGNRPVAWS